MTISKSGDAIKVHEITRSERGDGRQRISRVQAGARTYLLKQYGLKRSRMRAFLRAIGHATFAGKSSIRASTRRTIERETLALWAAAGVEVPKVLQKVEWPRDTSSPALALEWVPGRDLRDLLSDPRVPLEERLAVVSSFARVCGKRHDLAETRREPRFIFEHPTLCHIIVDGDRLVHIDLEIVFTRPRSIPSRVHREIVSFLRAFAKLRSVEGDLYFDRFITSYPNRARLRRLVRDTRRRLLPLLDGFGRRRSDDESAPSKRAVVDRLATRLQALESREGMAADETRD